jgi:transcriptional regulator with XRE-family HTH domain
MLDDIQIMGKVYLRDLRKLTGLSQKDFANKVGIPLTTYRRYEKDTSKMEAGQLFSICDMLGVSASNIKL